MLAYLSKSVSKSELNKNGIYCYHHCRYGSYNLRREREQAFLLLLERQPQLLYPYIPSTKVLLTHGTQNTSLSYN